MQQKVYECHMNSVDERVHADRQHFEYSLRARVTDKNYGQIKYRYLKRRSFTAELMIFEVLKFPKVRYVQ